MSTVEIITLLLSILFVLGTFASLLDWNNWWVRVFDFPRLQISVVLFFLMVFSVLVYDFTTFWHYGITGLLAASLVFQMVKIIRYSPLAPKQVEQTSKSGTENSISVMVSNVLKTNRNVDKLISLVEEMKPDMLLTLETDDWWEKQLHILEEEMPFSIKQPQDNLYGMHLYSRLELVQKAIKFRVQEDIPSFQAEVKLESGVAVQIHCLHPKPPFPTESGTSTYRDGELLMVGKQVKDENRPVLVFGDLNDVAWSRSTSLFQRVGELLDPRIGRGFFNTFHVKYPLMRWPLDHLFHSDHFKLIALKRLGDVGSDHFPMYIELHFEQSAPNQQDEPKASNDEEEQAEEKIEEANSKSED